MRLKKINNAEKIRQFIIDTLEVDVFENPKSRQRDLVEARALFYKIALETNPNLTLQALAKLFGKNHASIIHSLHLYNDWLFRELDIHKNVFIATHGTTLTLTDIKQSLLKDITSKVLKITDSTELEIFEQKAKQLLNF
jgi:hypothetical protein